ncbi:hypothetical protein ACP4OV_010737 [Aristida adscensionis]
MVSRRMFDCFSRPWEPRAVATPGGVGPLYAGGASRSHAVAVPEPAPTERDLLSQFTGDGGQRLQGRSPRSPAPSPTLSLRLECGGEQQQQADANIHGHRQLPEQNQAAAAAAAAAGLSLSAPRQASVGDPDCSPPGQGPVAVGQPDYRPQNLLPAAASAPPPWPYAPWPCPWSAGQQLAPPRPPRAPVRRDHHQSIPRLGGPTTLPDAAVTSEHERRRREALLQAVRSYEAALVTHRAAEGLVCAACRVRPPRAVAVPPHFSLCGECSGADAFRHDPASRARSAPSPGHGASVA